MSFQGQIKQTASICPCCHQAVANETPLDRARRDVSPMMRRVIEAVLRRPGMSGNELCDVVYQDDPDGGPEHGINTLRVTIWRENKKLKEHGLRVGASQMGARSGYFLKALQSA